jgi:hypothetical protein
VRPLSLPCALTLAGLALSPTASAQDKAAAPDRFGPPVRLKAGEKFLGMNRLYPSPVFHDVDGDGLADLVVGDLRGRLTVALRQKGSFTFGEEAPMKDVDGKEIDFHNW